MTGRRWLLLSLAGAAGALLIGKGAAQVYTDYLWYTALGAGDVWQARYGALTVLRAGAAVVATLFVFANLYAVRQSVVSLVLPRRIGNLDIAEEVERRHLTVASAMLSAVIGAGLAWSRDDWSGLVAARHGVPFGESDPYFASDLGFYVYWLPFELDLFTWTLTMVLIVIGLVVLLYALTPSLRWENGALYVSGYVRRHLAMLAGALLIVLAWHHRLDMFTALGGGSAPDGAFGYLDHRVRIPASLVLALVTLGAGLTVLWAGWTGQMRLAFAAITGVFIAMLGAKGVAPFIVDRAASDQDPRLRERPYVATRASYTRRAFAVDRILPADSGMSFATVSEAAPFVPIWDEGALAALTGAAPRGGGDFSWTLSDSGIHALFVGRAGAVTSVQPAWSGPAGYATLTPLDGNRPAMLIVPDSSARSLLVADSVGEIAAAPLRSGMARFANALSLQDFRVWLGALPEPNPKLVARRAVRERVSALAPIFVQGASIAPIWSAGTLFWAVDLYSASSTYPLSRRIVSAGAERAYFQHAGTALINARTGRTMIVADSALEPIAATWMRRFPGLFARPAAVPLGIRRQLQPPREGARAQAAALARFGTRGESSDAGRRLPDDEGADSALAASNPPLIGIPALGAVGYVIPLLDRSNRLFGLFIATGGPSQRSYWWGPGAVGPDWHEALDRLLATDTTSAPHAVRGYIRAVPVARQPVLVQPHYGWGADGRPRLRYVGVMESDSVWTAPMLVDTTLGAGTGRATAPADFRASVAELYAEMRRAMSRGDWAAYGRAFNELGLLLGRSRDQR